jgi:hypothetical protein
MSALSYRCGAAGCAYQTAMLKNLQAHKQLRHAANNKGDELRDA